MAEFFVYVCTRCDESYAGALEVTERRIGRKETTGTCPKCLEKLFGTGEGVESRRNSPGETPRA